MKNFKFLAVAALLAVATSAFAQFSNSTTKSSSSAGVDEWNTFWVEWNPMTLNFDEKGKDDQSWTGFSAGYSRTFNVSSPLFVEVGAGIQYSFYTYDEVNSQDDKYSLLSARVPANLMCVFPITNTSISLIPFAGVNLRYNFSGKKKIVYDDSRKDDEDNDLFDKKDMGDSDNTWKRFQIGYQIGLKARINGGLLLGISYGSDFSEIAKKAKFSTTSITLGYTF